METQSIPAEETGDGFDAQIETDEERHLIQDVYNVIKDKLVAKGVPGEEIAFIHDCKTAAQRSQLFADVRAGKVRILLGSTEKMGTGMNAQERLIALHHLDAPWRPSDIEQRNGRILRQGNRYSTVFILNYVTKGSFDGFIWQTLESKARFIDQVMRGEITARSAEDVSDTVLSMAQVKALASGNPKVMQKVALESELTKLSHVYAAWLNNRQSIKWDMDGLPSQIDNTRKDLAKHQAAQVLRDTHPGDPFAIDLPVNDNALTLERFTRREDAGKHIRELMRRLQQSSLWAMDGAKYAVKDLGTFRGFNLFAKIFRDLSMPPELWVCAGDREQVHVGAVAGYGCAVGESDIGTIQSLESQLRNIDLKVHEMGDHLQRLQKRFDAAVLELERPWEHAEKYAALKRQLALLNYELLQQGVDLGTRVQLPEIAEVGAMQVHEEQPNELSGETVCHFNLEDILTTIRAMHADSAMPVTREPAQVTESAPVPLPKPEPLDEVQRQTALEQLERAIDQTQAQLVFGQVNRLDIKTRRSRAPQPSPEAQIGFGW